MLTFIEVPPDYFPKVYVYFRKDTNVWRWKYKLPNGSELHCNAGTDETRAMKNARLKEKDLVRGLFNEKELKKLQESAGSGGLLTLDSAVARYLKSTGLEKAGSTARNEGYDVTASFRQLSEVAGTSLLAEISRQHIEAYRDCLLERIRSRDLRPLTAKNKLAIIKRVFKWLCRKKEILINPAAEVESIAIQLSDKARRVTLTFEQMQQIGSTAYESSSGLNIKALVLFMYSTGLRLGEALHLEWSDVDENRRVLRLRCKDNCPTKFGLGWSPKRRKERDVHLNNSALSILRGLPVLDSVGYVRGDIKAYPARFIFVRIDKVRSSQLRTSWCRTDDVRASWKGLLQAAGLWSDSEENSLTEQTHFVCHDLRRSFSDHAKQDGNFTVAEASKVLGHNPEVNMAHYSGKIEDTRMVEKMNQHPSNRLRLVDDSWYAGGTESVPPGTEKKKDVASI